MAGIDDLSRISQHGEGKFPNPFFDIASEYIPSDIHEMLRWCDYLYYTFGMYRQASRRVARYFLTEVELSGESDDERKKFKELLSDKLHIMDALAQVGDDYTCFHGDTPVPTRGGVFAIRELEGRTVDVLSKGGVWRPAEFKCFGEQELMEVEFSDGRTCLATPEHEWIVQKSTGGTVRVPTTRLQGRRIERTVAPRPAQGEEFREGVRHGFVFGDGSTYSKISDTKCGVATFCGDKREMLPFFEGHGRKPSHNPDLNVTNIYGLPSHYKELPDPCASAEYWYGFVSGFMAADGSVDTYGCCILTQKSKAALEAITLQLTRIGMVAGPVRSHFRTADFPATGTQSAKHYEGDMSYVTLLKQFMLPADILRPCHLSKFMEKQSDSNYGRFIGVKSVTPTGIFDKVYCCVEPETHSFVLANGVLTSNCYGNSFVSLYFPFVRMLGCKACGSEFKDSKVDYKLVKGPALAGVCPKCGREGEFRREDRRSPDASGLKLVRWDPKQIKLQHHPVSGRTVYYWDIPGDYAEKLRQGDKFYLETTPWAIVKCVVADNKGDSRLFEFGDDAIYHFKEATLSGVDLKGWGMPPVMSNFKLAYYIQILRRYDEAIALDYIMPFRILFPDAGPAQGQDAFGNMGMNVFKQHMQTMVRNRRRDPTAIQVAPFRVGYQAVGSEGQALAPKDSIQLASDELLNAVGYPADLYRGNLSIQAFPTALRLFEKTWGSLVDGYNDILAWVSRRICNYLLSGDIAAKLRPVTLADDIERKQLLLQAAGGMDVSKQTAYTAVGVDYLEEQRRVLEEQVKIQKLQLEAQEEQQAGGQGQQGQGGQGGPGGEPGATPGDVYEQAKEEARRLLFQVPDSLRRGELIKMKNSNPTLHALVLQEMSQQRQEMGRQGGAQLLQQGQQQGSSPVE